MAINNEQCRRCRREGEKLFLKGERCFSPKCAVVKRNYPPGIHGAKKRNRPTGYGLQMREKQKAKAIYGILEKQFTNYFQKAFKKRGDSGEHLLRSLEMRLDNIVFRLGFAKSRNSARQFVSHKHFKVNGKVVNIPSYQVKVKDTIALKEKSQKSKLFANLKEELKRQELPLWLAMDQEKLEGRVVNLPQKDDLKVPFDIKLVVEYYSK